MFLSWEVLRKHAGYDASGVGRCISPGEIAPRFDVVARVQLILKPVAVIIEFASDV